MLHIFCLFYLMSTQLIGINIAEISNHRCDRPDPIPHGSYRMRRIFVRFSCNRGYYLQGPTLVLCQNGRLMGEKPVCAKRGCFSLPEIPEHGDIELERNIKAVLTCEDGYIIAGNQYAYCNGFEWDRPIGSCRERNETHNHFCDFETEDLCGWTVDRQFFDFQWKRVMATNIFTTFRTGPRHDHTTKTADGGHYMLLESMGMNSMPHHLISPIYKRELSLKTACCFRFHYFMYGAGVGDLRVFVKQHSVTLESMWAERERYQKFHSSGNQNNNWNEHIIFIDELDEDFNIVFTVSDTSSHLGDIAIDDVHLLTGTDCPSLYVSSTPATIAEETENALYDALTCAGRCGESSDLLLSRKNGKFIGYCNCHADCVIDESCCLDFSLICDLDMLEATTTDEGSTVISSYTTTSTAKLTTATKKSQQITTKIPQLTTTKIITTTTEKPINTIAKTTTMPIRATTTTTVATTAKSNLTTRTTIRKFTVPTRARATSKLTSTTVITKSTLPTTTTKKIAFATTSTTTKTPTAPTLPTTMTTTTTATTSATTPTTKKSSPKIASTAARTILIITNATSTTTSNKAVFIASSTTWPIIKDQLETTMNSISVDTHKVIWRVDLTDLQGKSTDNHSHVAHIMFTVMSITILIICATLGYRCKSNIISRYLKGTDDNSNMGIVARFTQNVKNNTQGTIMKFRQHAAQHQQKMMSNRDSMNEPLYDENLYCHQDDERASITLQNKISEL